MSPRGIRYIHWYQETFRMKNINSEIHTFIVYFGKKKQVMGLKIMPACILTYLAQKDLSIGFTPSPSPSSPPRASSANIGVLRKQKYL